MQPIRSAFPAHRSPLHRTEIADALPVVIGAIPKKDPVNTGIALTQYFITRLPGSRGTSASSPGRVLTRSSGDIPGILRQQHLKRILSGILPVSNSRQTATSRSLPCMARTSPCRTWTAGCARCTRDPARRKGAGRTPEGPASGRLQNAISRGIRLVREESHAVRERGLEGTAEACPKKWL